MADRIKGLTIEIDGNTTKLSKALSGVNKDLKNTQSALKDVNRLLKLDPGNVDLIKQKQTLLKDAIAETKEKLDTLKTAMEQMKAAGIDKNSADFQALQREIAETQSNLKGLNKEAKNFGGVIKQELAVASKKMKEFGDKATEAGKSFLPATAAITGLATAAVKTASNFDTAMSQVAATMGTTTDQITELTELAQKMGSTTAFSASEAANGINILAMAGLNTNEIMAALPVTLNLAAAGAIDLGSAAAYVTGAVKGFNDSMDNAQHYADLMAKGATLANTDVNSLGAAMTAAAANASAYGQSAEEVTLALLQLANQNVTGEAAATSLNRAMADLYTPTAGAKKALEELGVAAYDESGKAKDFSVVIAELQKALSGYSEEQANAYKNTIFTTNGLNAFNKMAATSDETMSKFVDGLYGDDLKGSAAEQAATQLDNLNGQITLLKSALEGLAIAFGETLMPAVRAFVEKITDVITWLNGLDESTRKIIIVIAAVVAAIGPVLMMIGSISTGVSALMTVIPLLAGPIGIVIAIIAAVIAIGVLLYKNWDTIKEKATELWNNITEKFENIKNAVVEKTTAIKEFFGGAMDNIKETASNGFNKVKDITGTILGAVKDTAKDKLNNIKNAFEENGGGIKGLVAGYWEAIKGFWTAGFDVVNNLTGGKLGEIKDAFFNKFNEIKDSALTWGKDIIDNLVAGIKSKIEAVKEAVGNIAQTIKEFLGFSEPEKGPLSNFHTFMPDMIDLMTKGIEQNIGKVSKTMDALAQTLVPDTNINVNYNNAALAGYFDSVNKTIANNSQNNNVTVVLEGDAQGLFKAVQQQNRLNTMATGKNAFVY